MKRTLKTSYSFVKGPEANDSRLVILMFVRVKLVNSILLRISLMLKDAALTLLSPSKVALNDLNKI